MKVTNVEIKARCDDPEHIRGLLSAHGARFVGRDHQIDTYYKVAQGRLKLRQGNIENALIAYSRPDRNGPKQSDVLLYQTRDSTSLKAILDAIHEPLVVIDKQREIYFIENVKFHIDEVDRLGNFIEIEVIDLDHSFNRAQLTERCERYIELLGIRASDLLTHSYSDMLLEAS